MLLELGLAMVRAVCWEGRDRRKRKNDIAAARLDPGVRLLHGGRGEVRITRPSFA